MNNLKNGDRVKRTGRNFKNVITGNIYTFIGYCSDSKRDIMLDGCRTSGYAAAEFKRVEETYKSDDWDFEVASHLLINEEEIQGTLTREQPMAILHASDGTCMVYLHESIYIKNSYIKESIAIEFDIAMTPFYMGWPKKDSKILSRVVKAVRAVRNARLKKRFRNPLKCEVKMVNL